MVKPRLFRRRYIPDEMIELSNDEILHIDENIIVTQWTVLKPRSDFVRGFSCYYLNENFKVSRFIDAGGCCVYIYCDIIEVRCDRDKSKYVFHDLLADVIVYEDGSVRVLDLGDISDALDQTLITVEQAKNALRVLDTLLQIIYEGKLGEYTKWIQGL